MKQPEIELNGIISPKDFIEEIENLVNNKKLTYFDAVIHFCEKTGIGVETAAAIIKSQPQIKSRIRIDAEELHLLARTSRLPLD